MTIETKEGTKELHSDKTIVSIGYDHGSAFEENEHVHVIGDAKTVGTLFTAIVAANDLVMTYDTAFDASSVVAGSISLDSIGK